MLLRLDNNGCTPVHVACRLGCRYDLPYASIRYLIGLDKTVLTMQDKIGQLPIHKACRGGHTLVIELIMATNTSTITSRNDRNELPVFLLCKTTGKERCFLRSKEWTEKIWELLVAHPEAMDT